MFFFYFSLVCKNYSVHSHSHLLCMHLNILCVYVWQFASKQINIRLGPFFYSCFLFSSINEASKSMYVCFGPALRSIFSSANVNKQAFKWLFIHSISFLIVPRTHSQLGEQVFFSFRRSQFTKKKKHKISYKR